MDPKDNSGLGDSLATIETAELSLSSSDTSSVSSSLPSSSFTTTPAEVPVPEVRYSLQRRQRRRVSFNEIVAARKHIHVADITPTERSDAWFQKSEYRMILKNNLKIIREIEKSNNNNKKKQKKSKSKKKDNTKDEHHDDVDEEEERRGYSIRGLERETPSARKLRNEIYFEAICAIIAFQEELVANIQAMDEEYHSMMRISNNKRRMKKKNNSIHAEEQYYYDYFARQMAERYNEICKPCAMDARVRGLRDERIARKISLLSSSSERLSASSNTTATTTAVCFDFVDDDDEKNEDDEINSIIQNAHENGDDDIDNIIPYVDIPAVSANTCSRNRSKKFAKKLFSKVSFVVKRKEEKNNVPTKSKVVRAPAA